jgi:hypothetical protein
MEKSCVGDVVYAELTETVVVVGVDERTFVVFLVNDTYVVTDTDLVARTCFVGLIAYLIALVPLALNSHSLEFILISSAALLSHLAHPHIHIHRQHNPTHNYTQPQRRQFEVYRIDQRVKLVDRVAVIHGAIVHSNEQNGKLRQMANVGSVVVIGFAEGQVYEVVDDEVDADEQD